MEIVTMLIDCAQSVLQIVILFTLFAYAFKLRHVLAFSAIVAILHNAIPAPDAMWASTILHYFLFYLFFSVFCKIKPAPSSLLITFQLALTAVVEISSNMILGFMGHNIFYSMRHDAVAILRMRAVGSILLVLILILAKIFQQSRNIETSNKQVFGHLIFDFLILSMLTYPNMVYIEQEEILIPQSMWIHNMLLVCVLIGYGIYTYIYLLQAGKNKEQLKIAQLYTDMLRQSNEKLHDFKHDFDNILAGMHGYANANDMDGLLEMIHSLRSELVEVAIPADLERNLAEVPPLLGLLMSKIREAELKNIHLQVTVDAIAKDTLQMALSDYCRLAGILIDNAIEAAADTTGRSVTVELYRLDGHAYFHVVNEFNGEIDMGSIYQRGVSSKTGHSGVGLHEAAKIIERYQRQNPNIHLDTSYIKGEFRQTLRA